MEYKILSVGDIHFGYYNPELLYKEFQLIIDSIYEYEPDCVLIAGDYYDTKLLNISIYLPISSLSIILISYSPSLILKIATCSTL